MSGSIAHQAKKVVAFIRKGKPRIKDVILGPLVQRPENAQTVDVEWYFVFVHDAAGEAHISALGADEPDLAEAFRAGLVPALIAANFVLHDFDDDLAVVQMAEALWPSDRTRRLHEELKAEIAERLAQERTEWGVDIVLKERPLTGAEVILFGLDANTVDQYFAVENEGETVYFRMVAVDVGRDEPVMVAKPYLPP